MRQLYVKRSQPLQFALHICGNISSNNSRVNQDEIPSPRGSGHPEFSAAHFVVACVVVACVVVGEGAGVGAVVVGEGACVVVGEGACVVVGEGAGVVVDEGAGVVVDEGAGVVVDEGASVVVAGVGVVLTGAEQSAYTLAPAPPPTMRRRPGLAPMVFLQIVPDGANSVSPPHTELVQAE